MLLKRIYNNFLDKEEFKNDYFIFGKKKYIWMLEVLRIWNLLIFLNMVFIFCRYIIYIFRLLLISYVYWWDDM